MAQPVQLAREKKQDNSVGKGPIVPQMTHQLSFTRGYVRFDNQFGSPDTFKMAANKRKWHTPFLWKYAITLRIMVESGSSSGHRETLELPSIIPTLTLVRPRDPSVT